jgi:soluble lytic murein transglycosylase
MTVRRTRSFFSLFVCSVAATAALLGSAEARTHPAQKHQPRHHHTAKTEHGKRGTPEADRRGAIPLPIERPPAADLPPALAALKQAVDLIGHDKLSDATAAERSLADPVAQKLVEWALLRRAEREVGFQRYDRFITANPDWPGIALFRRRAEAQLWSGHPDAATVHRFLRDPASPLGHLALARLLLSEGDRARAEDEVRAVWRSAPLSSETESAVLSDFPNVLTRADHLARMDRRIGAKEFGAAMRAAKRVGDDQVAIVKACTAAEAKESNGGKLLDAVPESARDDLGYALCRIHWLLRNDSPGSNIRGRIVTPKPDVMLAAKLALSGSDEDLRQQDADEWWRERRVVARKLLDLGEGETAYQVAAKAAPPANPYYRAEAPFMAGWIALRFLHDPKAAFAHFAHIDDGQTDPRILARAAYWRARAAEAEGDAAETRAQYEVASRYPTAYYGQLARLRLGLETTPLRPLPRPADASTSEVVSAAAMLYAIGERDLAMHFVSELAKQSDDAAVLAGLGKLTAEHHDAPATFVIGEKALARGMALDQLAFPDFGVPSYGALGSAVDRSIVYSVVRTESAFDQRDRSSASAVGLMQVTPSAGRDTAKRLGLHYDWHRLVSDAAYNTQMGAGEVAALLKEYRGCYALVFAAYNAGRGRVQQWMAAHGDPRDPKVDQIDWIERIPFAETRNYVQRVLENLQVYRDRFDPKLATAAPGSDQQGKVKPAAAPDYVEALPH